MKALFTVGLISALTCAALFVATAVPGYASTDTPASSPASVSTANRVVAEIPPAEYCQGQLHHCLWMSQHTGMPGAEECWDEFQECLIVHGG